MILCELENWAKFTKGYSVEDLEHGHHIEEFESNQIEEKT